MTYYPIYPIPNIPLLRKVREHIEAHPDEWDQTKWRLITQTQQTCSTAYCFAGWAVTIAGAEWLPPAPDDLDNRVVREDDDCECENCLADGQFTEVRDRAISILGLTEAEGDALFWSHNTLPTIDVILDDIYTRAGL